MPHSFRNVSPLHVGAFLLVTAMLAGPLIARSPVPPAAADQKDEKRAPDSARVDGVFTIPADQADIQGLTLTVILFEYDPRLADVGAKKLDELKTAQVSHKKGKATTVTFAIGKDKKMRNDRQYYVSCRGYRGTEYVYYGKPGHGGIGKVLNAGNPVKVQFTGKRLKP